MLLYLNYWYFGYVKDVIKNWYLLFKFSYLLKGKKKVWLIFIWLLDDERSVVEIYILICRYMWKGYICLKELIWMYLNVFVF